MPADVSTQVFSLFDHNGKSWEFSKPASPDSYLDSISQELFERDEFLPYWTDNWPSSEALFLFLSSIVFPLKTSIVELGAGLAAISALCTAKGFFCTAVDISADACIFGKHNIERHSPVSNVLCSDWRHPALKKKFDVLVAADILYEKRWIDPVIRCLDDLISPNGLAYIADPGRTCWELFKTEAAKCDWTAEIAATIMVNNGRTTVEILKLKRNH